MFSLAISKEKQSVAIGSGPFLCCRHVVLVSSLVYAN